MSETQKEHVAESIPEHQPGAAGEIRLAIPEDKTERDQLLDAVNQYAAGQKLVPPLSEEELKCHSQQVIEANRIPAEYHDLITVFINNAVWQETVAAVPYERRVLLIPQCLRSTAACQAEMDEFGLLCEQCGSCSIGEFQAEAENLGYVVLVAEGTTVVTKLLASGKVDAVVGISCLAVLEKTFPQMSADAIPGIAIPLIYDGCVDTRVDGDWVHQAIRLQSDSSWLGQTEISNLRQEVDAWFTYKQLVKILGGDSTSTQKVALGWLAKTGKRWRPFLASAVYRSLQNIDGELPATVRKLAIAVECFHKASLVHDDIEDNDDLRYGEATLHCEHSTPIALNVGDLLLGEGYRMIAECGTEPEQIAAMLKIAASGHHTLCLGQGEELFWMKSEHPPLTDEVIEIFRCKTSPAFAVALCLGAIAAGANGETCKILNEFSDSLGIAFQIQDDIQDFHDALAEKNVEHIRPSLMVSLALDHADPDAREKLAALWQSRESNTGLFTLINDLKVEEKARQLCEHYKHKAVRTLSPLKSAPLKSLLRKVISQIVGKPAFHP